MVSYISGWLCIPGPYHQPIEHMISITSGVGSLLVQLYLGKECGGSWFLVCFCIEWVTLVNVSHANLIDALWLAIISPGPRTRRSVMRSGMPSGSQWLVVPNCCLKKIRFRVESSWVGFCRWKASSKQKMHFYGWRFRSKTAPAPNFLR